MDQLEEVQGTVKEVYPDRQLLVLEKDADDLLVTVEFKQLYPGDRIRLFGVHRKTPLLGKLFAADYYREVPTRFWLAKWLKFDKNLSNRNILRILLRKKGIEAIWTDLEQQQQARELLDFLWKKGVSEQALAELEYEYGWGVPLLLKDPYRLLESPHIHLPMVEQLVERFSCESPQASRAKYLVTNLLKKAYEQGHFMLPKQKVEQFLTQQHLLLRNVSFDERIRVTEETFALHSSFSLENAISRSICERIRTVPLFEEDPIERWEQANGFSLADNQKKAVRMALSEQFCVVTGGPGVGKTTVCKCITDLLGETQQVLMAAPTGRAAKRAKESTGLPATTIHRLLEYNGTGFRRHQERPIETDILVIDEASMIDAPLLGALLDALPTDVKIIFVGDVDQLPSVGPGQVLRDLIASAIVPVTRLTDIFRQAADSPIISCAYAVNEGKMPSLVSCEDLKYHCCEDEDGLLQETLEVAVSLYRKYDAFDVQLLIPQYKGAVGIDSVNRAVQDALFPDRAGVRIQHYDLKFGDKVIQTKNDSKKGVYNGDVGLVTFCTPEEIRVRFQGESEETMYEPSEFPQLQLSYAVTVHRSQGSEYANVVIPLTTDYRNMLQKNLLYTGITRAKKKLWILYEQEAFVRSVDPKSVPVRHTHLQELLRSHKKDQ